MGRKHHKRFAIVVKHIYCHEYYILSGEYINVDRSMEF
jgi:hypothetical protein